MKVELIIEDNHIIGWSMEGDNPEETEKLAAIRDTQFFGFDDTRIVYDGRSGGDDTKGNPGILRWKQYKHTREGKEEQNKE